jgi:hypothetical protein
MQNYTGRCGRATGRLPHRLVPQSHLAVTEEEEEEKDEDTKKEEQSRRSSLQQWTACMHKKASRIYACGGKEERTVTDFTCVQGKNHFRVALYILHHHQQAFLP